MGLYSKNIPRFTGWTQYTPVIPKQYWDVYSLEERIKILCLEYDKIRKFLDTIGDAQNEINTDLDTRMTTLEAQMSSLQTVIDDLVNQIDGIVDAIPVYDPTQGKNVTSTVAHRNMFRELAVFGARVNQMATLTTADASSHSNVEMAVIGNYTVFENKEPRVTPIKG